MPLSESHLLLINKDACWKCGRHFGHGVRAALNPIETPEESGSLTVQAKAVCATCHLRGKEIQTPIGRRIVERIKDGDGSPFSVLTTDGAQWRDSEVGP